MESRSAVLEVQVAVLRDILLAMHLLEESNWIAVACTDSSLCNSAAASRALESAGEIAKGLGYFNVAGWIATLVNGCAKPHQEKTSY